MNNKQFVKTYNNLMWHLYEIMDGTLHSVADALEIAKEKTSMLGGLTQDEINQVADFLMRDLAHAAHSTSAIDNQDSLTEWFKFDVEQLEHFALDAFTSLADKTRIELAKIENQAKQYHPYYSGDIAGPGTFNCQQCGKQIAFKSTSQIPECSVCKATTFSRS